MLRSRTFAEYLILIFNIPVVLLGIVIGWMWITDAVGHYVAEDGDSTSGLGMCIGFLLFCLIWNTIVMTYLLLRRPAGAVPTEYPPALASPVPVAVPITVPIGASKSTPAPVRAKATTAAPATNPSPEWVDELAEVHAQVRDPAALPNPPPTAWMPDVARAEQASRPAKE